MLSLLDSPETTLLLLRIQNDPQFPRLDDAVRPGHYTAARLLEALHDLSHRGLVGFWRQRHEGPAPGSGLPEYEGGSREATWWHLTADGRLVAAVVGQQHQGLREVDEPLGREATRLCKDRVSWPLPARSGSHIASLSSECWSHENARSLTVAYEFGFCHVVVDDDGAVRHGPHFRAPTTMGHPHWTGSERSESRPRAVTAGFAWLHQDTMRYLLQSAETTLLLLGLVNDPRTVSQAPPRAGTECTEERLSDVLGDLEARGLVRSRVYGATDSAAQGSGRLPEHILRRSTVRWWWLTQAGYDVARMVVVEHASSAQ